MRLLKDSAIYVFGEILAKAMPFLLIPYLSRRLGVEGYGELAYYQVYLMLFIIIIGLSQDGAVARYFYYYGKRSINIVVRAGYFYSAIVGSIIAILCWMFDSFILSIISLSVVFQIYVNVQLSLRQCQKQAFSYTVIQLFSAVMSVLFTVLLLEIYTEDLVEKRFIALLLRFLVTFFVVIIFFSKGNRIKISLKKYKLGLLYILSFGLPLIFHHASFFVKGQIDRMFIFHRYDEASLGVYAMGANLASVFSILIMAINKATIPYYYEYIKLNKINRSQIYRWILYSLGIIPFLMIAISFIPESLFIWLLGKNEFVGVKYYFMLFVLSSSFTPAYLLLVNFLFYNGRNKEIAICSVLSAIIYILSLLILVNTKVEYIPYASILASVGILPLLYFFTKREKLLK